MSEMEMFHDQSVEKIELAARTAHEVNRLYCGALGDETQAPWDEAPAWQRESCLAGVMAIVLDPSAPRSRSHEKWLEHKKADGWRYGPTKNPETKEHPCMVPYDELPVDQKVKDLIFSTIVHDVLGI